MDRNKFVLYAYPFRTRAERVLWALKEFGYPYEVVRLDPFKGETKTKEFLSLNPSGKVPILTHNGEVLTESLAILEYLNDISTSKKLIPTESKAAYKYRKVVHYGLTEIEPYLWVAEQDSRSRALYTWPKGTYKDAIAQVRENIKPVWEWINASPYIAGDQFTLADIYFYQLIAWSKEHQIETPSAAKEYLKRLESRANFPAEILIQREDL
ncbi:MAG: glutathione S-transferase family protein [Candidatus Polarisedimenticolaceae bacterium]|nr:glutathione S-transferase family protein [Candidatus Polarisedimenticolaceae bacterium]